MVKDKKIKLINKAINKKSHYDKLYKSCEKLWREIVKFRAGGVCELTGTDQNCAGHHYWGKSTHALRFDPNNGVYLSYKKHIQGIHSTDPSIAKTTQDELDKYMIQREGQDEIEKIKMRKNVVKSDLQVIEIYLKEYLKKLKRVL